MAQESRLSITIDSRSAEQQAKDLDRVLGSLDRAGIRVSSSSVKAGNAIDRAGDRARVASRQFDSANRAFARMGAQIGTLVGTYLSVGKLIEYADGWTEIQNRLRLVTNSNQELAQATDDVYQVALTTNQALDGTIQVYQRFAQNADALGISLDKVAELTDTVSKAVAVSGASTQEAEAAMKQFGQALSSGVFRGDEFNSVMEQTPALAQAIARGMGVAVGELRAMAADGKLTATVLVDALTKARGSVGEQFQTRVTTLGQSFTNLQTVLNRYVGEANVALGSTNALGGAIDDLSGYIDGLRGNYNGLLNDIEAIDAAFDGISFAFNSTFDAIDEFGRQFQKMLGASGDNVTSLGDLITTSFSDSFLATAKELDALWDVFDGSARAIEALFDTTTYNIQAAFENVFNAIRESVSMFVHNVATTLNELPWFDIDTSVWVGPGQKAFKSLSDAASEAYAQGGQTLSLYDDLLARIANSAIERSLAAEGYTTGGTDGRGRPGASGAGVGTGKGKGKKAGRPDTVYGSIEDLLFDETLFINTVDGMAFHMRDKTDEMSQYAIQARRNIQTELGDGLYNILTGKFDDIGKSFTDMLLKMATDAAAANLADTLFGGGKGFGGGLLGGLVSGLFGGGSGNLTGSSLSGASWGPMLSLDSGGFTGNAPVNRFAGFVHGQEGVLNAAEIRAIGGEAGFNALRRAIRGGGNAVGGMGGRPALPPSAPQGQQTGVVVNITNNGQPVSATGQPKVSLDSMGRMVIDVMLGDLRKNGPYARQLKGALA